MPMTTYTLHTAKTNLSRLLEQACAGEEVIIARDQEPLVRLVPIKAAAPRRVFGVLRGQLEVTDTFFEPLPPEDSQTWG